ncbi:MAG: 16S rRNA (guanine(527)-N(7))-methyltransferase RsmG [Pseudomonadota bacterium]
MIDQFKDYYELLSHWNKRIKLVSKIDDFESFKSEHIDDATEVCKFLSDANSLLDIGTGAGIPGILIKIVRPQIRITLLDSTRKKISFCEEAIRKLRLEGIEAVWGRAEDKGTVNKLGCFDTIISRATWSLLEYLPIAAPYMCGPSSKIIAMKGPKWQKELTDAQNELKRLNLKVVDTHEYQINSKHRCMVIIGQH